MPSAAVRRRRTFTGAGLVLALVLALVVTFLARQDATPVAAAETPVAGAEMPSSSPSSARKSSGEPITLAFGGDVHFEPPIAGRLAADPRTALGAHASEMLESADLAMVNLETAVTDGGGTRAPKQYAYAAPRSAFTALRSAGVDVTTMANNHGLDFGASQIPIAQEAAKDAGVRLVGIGEDEKAAYAPAYVDVRGQRVAVIGATQVLDDAPAWTAGLGKPGLASAKRVERLSEEVRDARREADLVVVYLHWGRELESCPTDVQRSLHRSLVDAGADIIVGSHAHVLLGGGWTTSGAYVDYGLGNFVFYAKRPSATQSGVLVLTAKGSDVTKARWVPARISGGVPRDPKAGDAAAIANAKKELRVCTGLLPSPPD